MSDPEWFLWLVSIKWQRMLARLRCVCAHKTFDSVFCEMRERGKRDKRLRERERERERETGRGEKRLRERNKTD